MCTGEVSGLDIAGVVGIYIGCAKNRVPVVMNEDNFHVAGLIAYRS